MVGSSSASLSQRATAVSKDVPRAFDLFTTG